MPVNEQAGLAALEGAVAAVQHGTAVLLGCLLAVGIVVILFFALCSVARSGGSPNAVANLAARRAQDTLPRNGRAYPPDDERRLSGAAERSGCADQGLAAAAPPAGAPSYRKQPAKPGSGLPPG